MALYSEAQQQRGSLSLRSIRWLRNCQGKRGLSFRPPPLRERAIYRRAMAVVFQSQENSMTQGNIFKIYNIC
jgi:hypothetical protein